MTRRKNKGFNPPPHPKSCYDLLEVTQKIANKDFLINQNASQDAYKDFVWGISEILEVYKMLQPKHFYKTDSSKNKPGVLIDYYKARLKGEDIYTHFYIDDEKNLLIINSFKKV